jgi:hypothetical protein
MSLKWSRRRKAVTLVTTFVLILIVTVIALVKILSSPAEGTIMSPNGKKIEEVATTKAPGSYSGKYISFNYPANFDITPSQKSGNYLEVVSLYSNDHAGKQISIGVVMESLDNDSGISYRRAHPEIYKRISSTGGSIIFSKDKDGSEYTGFMAHNGLVASLSLSSTYSKDLSADYSAIIKNGQWK